MGRVRGAAPSPAKRRGQCPGTRSRAAPQRAVRDQRCHWQPGRRHTAPVALPTPPGLTPRREQAENGFLPATPASPPGSAQGRGNRRPGPGVTKWRLLFVWRRAAASIRPAGHRDRGCCLPPALRGEDPHRCLEGGRAKGARAKLSRLDPQRDPSSAFPHWTKWRPATTPPAFIYG